MNNLICQYSEKAISYLHNSGNKQVAKFAKGKSGNPKGKEKGTVNKITKDAKALFVAIMERQVDQIESSLDELRIESADKYLTCVSKLMPYFMPKQIDLKSDGEKLAPPVIQILPFTEES